MRIGLVRHLPVSEPMPSGWMTAAQLHAWRQRYDRAAIESKAIALDSSQWARCYSSDLQRAYVTAQALYSGEIVQTPLLREAETAEFRTGPLLLPVPLWRWVLRIAWMTGHCSQRASRDDFRSRVQAVADLAEAAESDILLVSHAGMMAYLRRELVRRGFSGPKFQIAEHGRVYVLERNAGTKGARSRRNG